MPPRAWPEAPPHLAPASTPLLLQLPEHQLPQAAPQPAPALHPFLRPPHPQHGGRGPAKPVPLPKLGSAAASGSPRGNLPSAVKAGWPAPQLAAGHRKQQAAAAAHPPPEAATIPALRRPSPVPQPLPSISPEASQHSATSAWLPGAAAAGLQAREDDDSVLIGSTAPSFSLAPTQQQQQQRGLSPARSPQPTGPSAAPSASPAALPRRSSCLSSQLGSEDLSLAALAASSRRGTRYTSASGGSSGLPSSQSSRAASAGGEPRIPAPDAVPTAAAGAEQYAADFEDESPGPCPGSSVPPLPPAPAGPPAPLSSGELALLRQTLLELQLPAAPAACATTQAGSGSSEGGSGGSRSSCAPGNAAAAEQEIPDQVVLRELGERLGRLDSAKRRVLLQVLAKLDMAPAAAAAEPGSRGGKGTGEGPAPSRHSTSRAGAAVAEAGGGAAAFGASQLIADSMRGSARGSSSNSDSPALLSSAAVQPPTAAAPPQQRQPAGASSPAAATLPTAPQQSPSKGGGIMGRLAALRLGRSSSLGKPAAAAAPQQPHPAARAAPQPAAAAQPPPAEAVQLHSLNGRGSPHVLQPAQPAQPAGSPRMPSSLGHSLGAPKLQGMLQQRHRERSRLSVDGLPGVRQKVVAPAAAVAAVHGAPAGARASSGAGDALAAFEQQHAEEEAPGLAASPTVLALGGWQQQADALDTAVPGLHAGPARQARSGSSSGDAAAFAIPACPSGRVLELRIFSTWGDPHFVGLAGLELFDSAGRPLTVRWATAAQGCMFAGAAAGEASRARPQWLQAMHMHPSDAPH